ncbi:MAG: hypothetical protein M0Z75_17340 [Nitrospiraceae bacterium]|nr:hypothetical protein [Nitrospiraceae bacterium]
MADKTKKYIVHGTSIKHGRGKEHKVYEHGQEIELTDEEAAPIKKHLKEAEEKKK